MPDRSQAGWFCLPNSSAARHTRPVSPMAYLLKIFPQNPGFSQVLFHHHGIVQTPQRPLQPQPIPSVQHSDHFALVMFYECLANFGLQLISLRLLP